MNESLSYETDFHAWAIQTARWLRDGQLDRADVDHLAEELESMGASERRELASRLPVLLTHLLKHQFQPERRGTSWRLTIAHQRTAIERLLEQSPSLRSTLSDDAVANLYRKAVRVAIIKTDLDRSSLPLGCPYRLDAILDED